MNDKRPAIDLRTGCDCGAVTLTATGQVISMFQCACVNCQRVTGTGHSSVFLFPESGLAVTGAVKTFSRPADSGANFTRHFCPACGTTLYGESSRAPGLCILPAGLFAGQNEWFVPGQLIFARSHQGWDEIADSIPWHESYRPTG
ncbi:MAG TPA: GFA family protein [Devosia sp.]|jgi:hypothetical protein|uniref:GFA family protein n=1 Tax=Devosia sp. TaxID=1871048 RepID=UPI002F930D20